MAKSKPAPRNLTSDSGLAALLDEQSRRAAAAQRKAENAERKAKVLEAMALTGSQVDLAQVQRQLVAGEVAKVVRKRAESRKWTLAYKKLALAYIKSLVFGDGAVPSGMAPTRETYWIAQIYADAASAYPLLSA